jgi:hypothetical protein
MLLWHEAQELTHPGRHQNSVALPRCGQKWSTSVAAVTKPSNSQYRQSGFAAKCRAAAFRHAPSYNRAAALPRSCSY